MNSPVDDEERVRVLVVDVPLRSALTGAVVELGDGDLVGLDEHGRAPPRPVGDRVALPASRPPDHDEPGIGRHGVRRRPLVEPGHIATDVVAVARARCMEGEEPRRPVAGHLDGVHDLGRDERPALRADPMHAILELKRELSLEHVQRLAVSGMDVGRRLPPSGSCAHVDRGELLDVDEERDVELSAPQDDLAFSDLDHVPQPRWPATSSSTATRRTRSSTGRRSPRSSPHARPSSGTRRSRSPITTASTARSSSRTRRRRSASGRSRAPRSRSTAARTSRCSSSRARGYANLCRLLTTAHAGTRRVGREDREPLPPSVPLEAVAELERGSRLPLRLCATRSRAARSERRCAPGGSVRPRALLVELQRPFERGDARRLGLLRDLAEHLGVETVATGDVHAHHPRRTLLQDVLVAIRCRTSLEGCEPERRGNRESYLRPPEEMLERFSFDRDAAERSVVLAERLEFDLTEELGYRYPDFSDGDETAIQQLAAICQARSRRALRPWRHGSQGQARARLESELALIDELGLAGFFLLHHEVLEIARECAREVRGTDSPRAASSRRAADGEARSARSSATSPGLSHVDPVSNELSLGRFLNRELASVPDIDLDFPRDIREKLIVRVTERYGREHAALVASFATYRSRGAIRDVGKALGLPFAELERLARLSDGWNAKRVGEEVARLPDGDRKLESRRWRAFAWLTGEISGLPRHVSQHPGGMIVSTRPLIELVPVQPAAMAGRQLCQWDKDSCSDAGFLKIDLLGLGMLSAVEDCVEQIARTHDEVIDLSRIPFDDAAVYDDIQRADTVGAFQIESRAQMQSLLRTKPENLDDVTVQVALVRPGPIQGKAVHPYIDARQRLREDPAYVFPVDHELLREPLRVDLRRRRLPGPGARGRDRARGLHRGGGGGAAPCDEPQAQPRRARGVPRALHRGRSGEGRPRGDGGHGLRQARRLLRLRLPEGACGRVRAARVPVDVAAPLLPRGVPVRAPERAADGLLPARDARPRRAAARRGGAPRRRQPERSQLRRRVERRAHRPDYISSLGRTRPRRSSPSGTRTGRTATSPISRAGRSSPTTASRRS